MSNSHLSEEQVQFYTMGMLTDPAAAEHVAGCAECRRQVSGYQLLYDHIASEDTLLPDMQAEQLIVDAGMKIMYDRKERRFLYGLLLGVFMLLITGLIGYWHTIRVVLSGVTAIGITLGGVLLLAVLAMHVMELYKGYEKKIRALSH